jgi:hypothetical protein
LFLEFLFALLLHESWGRTLDGGEGVRIVQNEQCCETRKCSLTTDMFNAVVDELLMKVEENEPGINTIICRHIDLRGGDEKKLKAVKSVNLHYEGIWTENE